MLLGSVVRGGLADRYAGRWVCVCVPMCVPVCVCVCVCDPARAGLCSTIWPKIPPNPLL